MPLEVKVPALGEGVESGDILEVFVKPGDEIKVDDPIVELETDKATVTIPSTDAGKVISVLVSSGATVSVGQTLVQLEAAATAPTVATPPTPAKAPAKPLTYSEPIPASKPMPSMPQVASVPEVKPIPPTQPIVAKSTAPPVPPQPTGTPQEVAADERTSAAADLSTIAAGPAIRRFAREVGVDLRHVKGSGPQGRILRDDILGVVRTSSARIAANGNLRTTGESDHWGPIRTEKLTKIRATIAQKMHESWSTVPRVTNFDDADVTELEQIRQSNKKDYEARGIKLTTMPFIVKAVAMSLRSHPIINASIDLQSNQIIFKEYINIGIAIDSERGLVVPSLRAADRMAIPDIARSLGDLAENVRNGKFSVDDLRGSTFSISNLGSIGGTYSTPIINVPETAILLIGRARKLPVAVGEEIQIRLMMPLSLSYDHRLIDGAAAARFLNDVIAYLQSPGKLLLAL